MEQRTNQFIEGLLALESMDEILDQVNSEVESYKQSLIARGYRFNEEEYTDELVGGQRIMSSDASDITYLDEIAYIKRGLATGWVSRLDDQQRFDEIRDRIEDIILPFE